MGLSCSLLRATAGEVDGLLNDPESLPRFLEDVEGPSLPVREVRPKGLLGFLLRLVPITITEVVPESERGDAPPRAPRDPERSLNIERAWHGLHFLFTGTSDGGEEPACYFVHGGEAIDDEGYGRALRPAEVQGFASFLASLTPDELRRRYDPARMTTLEIDPDSIWDDGPDDGESPREWLIDCFNDVKAFTTRAAAAGDGMIIHIS